MDFQWMAGCGFFGNRCPTRSPRVGTSADTLDTPIHQGAGRFFSSLAPRGFEGHPEIQKLQTVQGVQGLENDIQHLSERKQFLGSTLSMGSSQIWGYPGQK